MNFRRSIGCRSTHFTVRFACKRKIIMIESKQVELNHVDDLSAMLLQPPAKFAYQLNLIRSSNLYIYIMQRLSLANSACVHILFCFVYCVAYLFSCGLTVEHNTQYSYYTQKGKCGAKKINGEHPLTDV